MSGGERGGSKTRIGALLGGSASFTCFALLFALVGLRDRYNGLLADSYVYLAAAEQFGRFGAADRGLLRHIFEAYPFPPLYPLLLGLLGGGAMRIAWTYALGAVTLAAIVMLCRCLFMQLGAGRLVAGATALAFALLPITLAVAMGVLSEPLFLALLLGAALLLERPSPGAVGWCGAALIVGLAPLVRTAGVVAVAAFLAAYCLRRAWRAAPPASVAPLIAVLPIAAWQLTKLLAGFDGYQFAALGGHVSLDQVFINVRALAHHLPRAFDDLGRAPGAWALAGAGLLALGAALPHARRGSFQACFVLAYLPVLLAWPYPDHAARLAWVALPFALGLALCGLRALGRGRAAGAATALLPLLLFALLLPGSATRLAALWHHRAGPEALILRAPASAFAGAGAARAARFEQRLDDFLARALPGVPADACVASIIPQRVLLHGPRRGVDLANAMAAGRPLAAALADCPWVLMVAAQAFPRVAGVGPMFPFHEIAPRMQVIDFERDDPEDPDSPLVAMLAKIP